MGGLGAAFWGFAALALMLAAAAFIVVRSRPRAAGALYAVMALGQAGHLLCMAIDSSTGSTWAPSTPGPSLRRGFDLATLAAAVHLSCIHPTRLQIAGWLPAATWSWAMLTLLIAYTGGEDARGWWMTQAALLVVGGMAMGVTHLSVRTSPHPTARLMRRFGLVAGSTWVLLQAAVVIIAPGPSASMPSGSASTASANTLWQVLFALGLASAPFLPTLHSARRRGLALRLPSPPVAGPEQLFEHLFRTTREIENHPEQAGPALSRLLEELFAPREATLLAEPTTHAHILSDGSAMRVPVPVMAGACPTGTSMSIVLRHAQRGQRLFTDDDARLAGRLCEQLQRSVAFDLAVEHGRNEERRRLAQDLHDDIGARLLTLMYKAESPELEDYARHTLQDLKTLTRGLAASRQPLAHALAEWKADVSQRLSAAHLALRWTAAQDADVELSVIQWSALTRVLRELITNVIAHAQARTVEVDVSLVEDRLLVTVADDGTGRTPAQWAPGLGLGGVRKRVRQLGGEVSWHERLPQGICCRVRVERLSASR